MKKRTEILLLAALTLLLAASVVYVITVGSASLELSHVIGVLKYQLFHIGERESGWSMVDYRIVWSIRMPRILMAVLTGAGLSVCGAVMQSVVLNPIADPYVLGVSSGASAGAAFALIAPISVAPMTANVTGMALIGAMTASVVVYSIARAGGGAMNPISLILSGTAISALMSAITNLLILFAKDQQSVSSVYYWQMGSIASAEWSSLPLPAIAVTAGIAVLLCCSTKLNLLMMGEEDAMALGLNVKRFRLFVMAIVSLIVSTLVSQTGIIGFVGLMIPHIVRMLTHSSDNHVVLSLSAVCGAIFLVWADTAARSILSIEIPIGVITAFSGSPFFVYLMVRRNRAAGGRA